MTDVYYNRHRWCWSLRERGRVVGYADEVHLLDVRLVVSIAAVMRYRVSDRRDVCGWARGTLTNEPGQGQGELIGFDPYRFTSFVNIDGREISGCDRLYLLDTGGAFGWGLRWL